MTKRINTYIQFLPLVDAADTSIILRNEHYFSVPFSGGNYLSTGTTLQKLFGGQSDVALMAELRPPSDGLVLTSTIDDSHDKRNSLT